MFTKISFKLIFTISIATIIIISAFAYVNIQSQSKVLITEIQQHTNELSETIKSATKFAMLKNDRPYLHNIIKTIGDQPCIKTVRILNKEGEIIYSADTTEIGSMLDKKAEACYTCHATGVPMEKLPMKDRTRIFRLNPDSSRIFGVINPIYNEPSCWNADCHVHSRQKKVLGVLDLTVCLKFVDQKIDDAKMKMVLFAVIAIAAISLLLWFFVKIWVDKPVRELVDATKEVAAGNLNYTLGEMGNDELGMLARSFNNMTKKLAEARQQLFQSDKMASLGRLAAGVAHEINNPLTGILTYSSFLLKRTKNLPEFQEDLSVIVRETKRSREIVKGLLDFARQSVPKKNKADINQIINHSLTVVENQLTIKDIRVEKNLQENLPAVTIDANQMQQVFTNLLVNAGHAISDKGGKVIIASSLLSLKPFGNAKIKQALCPKGHNLMDQQVKIHGLPTIRMRAKAGNNDGYVNLDPIYGKNRNHYGIKMKEGAQLELFCPKCQISLIDKKKKCPKCDAPVYFFEIPGKGHFEGCTAKGCDWQFWEAIEAEGAKDYIAITISDNGSGIPKENLSKIFEPFYTTKGQKGTGLGLSVIWGIVDNHNGTITVESEVGVGTTFTVRLPVV